MELTVNGFMPAPAWLIEVIRELAGNQLSAGRGARPYWRQYGLTHLRDPQPARTAKTAPKEASASPSPMMLAAPIRSPIPRIDGRDFILIYRLPDGTGARPRDIVVARFGRVELNAREVDITQQEILTKHPNATFLVLRQQTEIGRPGAQWVRPDGGRIDPRWVERFESWP